MTDAEINDRFFNLPPGTLDAIRAYQRSPDPACVGPVFNGIMEKYLPEGARLERLPGADDGYINALGLESLTLLEVVLDLQDALNIRLGDDELRGLTDLHDAHALLLRKVAALGRGELPPATANTAPTP